MSVIRQGLESADLDVPVVLPTLNLDFANSQSLDRRITFTRGSTATRVNRNGLIETVGVNQPRFDFDPISGECKGLLIEESRSNLLVRSEDFSLWSISNASVQSDAITAPDGNTTADKLVENSSTGNKEVTRGSITFTSGASLTFSCFVKAGERKLFRLAATTGFFSAGTNAYFNLTSGTVSSINGGVTSASIIPYPNGWYRCAATMLPTSSGSGNVYITLVRSGTISSYGGDGTSGIYIWGAQLETGAFPTSYIPTTTSSVTRSADNASMTGTNFSSWYNQTESTIFCEFNAYNNIGAGQKIIIDIRGSAALGLNLVQLQLNYISATSQHIYHNLYQNGVNFADCFGLLYTTGPTKNIMRYKDLDTFVASKDGNIRKNSQARLQTIPLTKNMNSLTFGTFNGAISKFAYYPKALNDAEIQYLTQ